MPTLPWEGDTSNRQYGIEKPGDRLYMLNPFFLECGHCHDASRGGGTCYCRFFDIHGVELLRRARFYTFPARPELQGRELRVDYVAHVGFVKYFDANDENYTDDWGPRLECSEVCVVEEEDQPMAPDRVEHEVREPTRQASSQGGVIPKTCETRRIQFGVSVNVIAGFTW